MLEHGGAVGSPDHEAVLEQALNPLHRTILIALMLRSMVEKQTMVDAKTPGDWMTHRLAHCDVEPFPVDASGFPLYRGKEMGGVAGLYREVLAREWEVIFANDLGMDIHGIDVIARAPETGRLYLCEAKGTSAERARGPAYYLRETRHKGRQLSHRWCWSSMVDCAFQGATAGAFLDLLELLLAGDYERLLCVTRLSPGPVAYGLGESRVWSEQDMERYGWFRAKYDLSRQRRWYEEILRADQTGVSP